ncbi:RPGR regulator, partial [Hydrobates tethys]|nr:RPGR regulator [Oceanodroma tethys]
SETDVYTFGLGQYGQLGHGTFIFETSVPKSVKHLKRHKICNVTCGENHTAVIAENGLMFTFGDGRHGKLGLGEENFTNQFDPTLCYNFLRFTVLLVACGGCHMLVFAAPRPKGSEEALLEDLYESPLTATISKISGDSQLTNTLQLTSARMRRRERENSPEQFIRMARTLPPLGEGCLKSSLPVTSNTSPLCFSAAGLRKAEPTKDRDHEKEKNRQKDKPGESSAEEDSDNENNDRNLGDTTDILNMTHAMKLNPSDQSLKLSPLQKQKEQNLSGDEETDDDDDEETEEEEAEEKEAEGEEAAAGEEAAEGEEAGGGGEGTEKEEIEEKYENEKHSKTPEGEKSSNSTVETVETEETTQKATIIQQEEESTDNHTVNNSSENTDDQITGGIIGKKKFSLFKRKPLTGQKNVCSGKEDRSGKSLQSEQEKEKEDLSGEDSKDENQNHTVENSREAVTNEDRR